MYRIKTEVTISAAHKLNLPYESPCKEVHGHNWKIAVIMQSRQLTNGMVLDFTSVKKFIKDKFDHKTINDIIEQPTAENIAKYIFDELNYLSTDATCEKVEVQETEGNYASYEI